MRVKAQISVEFLAVVSLVLVILLPILYQVTKSKPVIYKSKEFETCSSVCNELAEVINSVYLAGNGAKKNITLLAGIQAKNINITTYSQGVIEIRLNEIYCNCRVAANLTEKSIAGGRLEVSNNNNLIDINQI